MKILALEFSSPQRSVAALEFESGKGNLEKAIVSESETIEIGTPANAFSMTDEVLHRSHLDRAQIESLAIGIGPGSYTGIRAAIAIAQGWQLAVGVKLLGISSAECVAHQARTEGISGFVNIVIDAQREEFYLSRYEINDQACREVGPLRIATLAEVHEREQAGDLLVGPEVTRWFPGGKIVFPRALTLGKLAVDRNDFIAGEKLEPIYLRETKFVKAPAPRIL